MDGICSDDFFCGDFVFSQTTEMGFEECAVGVGDGLCLDRSVSVGNFFKCDQATDFELVYRLVDVPKYFFRYEQVKLYLGSGFNLLAEVEFRGQGCQKLEYKGFYDQRRRDVNFFNSFPRGFWW